MTDVLGSVTFLETPTVNGTDVLLNAGGVPAILSGITSARPAAGTGVVGRLWLDTTTSTFYRDNGASWDALGGSSGSTIAGTSNQITVVQGTNVTPSVISIANNVQLPGLEGITFPSGATSQRPVTALAGETRFNSDLAYVETYASGFWQPLGQVLQTVTGTIAASSGTVTVPLDNTIPQNNEGNLIWSQTFTPLSTASKIIIAYSITVASSTASRTIILSTFAGSTNIGSIIQTASATANAGTNMVFYNSYAPASTAAILFTARLGTSASATTYCNQTSAAALGGALATKYTIMEVL